MEFLDERRLELAKTKLSEAQKILREMTEMKGRYFKCLSEAQILFENKEKVEQPDSKVPDQKKWSDLPV